MLKKTWVKLALVLLMTGGFLFFFFRSVPDWGAVLRSFGRVNWPVFLLALLLTPLHLATRALRWRYLLIHEKRDVRFANLFAGNAVGFMVTFLLPGRIGEIVKPLYCARKECVRPGFVLGTVVVERIFDILTMCVLLGAFLLARPLYAARFAIKPEASARLTQLGIAALVLGAAPPRPDPVLLFLPRPGHPPDHGPFSGPCPRPGGRRPPVSSMSSSTA